jgi:NarL family two-component system response regulator LiaR
MSDSSITVLVVDDHEIVRRGIITLLETESDIEVVGQAENGREALSLAQSLEPDVILMDLVMPEMDGVEAIREIRERGLPSHVLVLTSFGSDDKLFPAVRAGALGYLLKDTSPVDLVRAIHKAAEGQSALTPAVARRLLQEFSTDLEPSPPEEPLSDRESDVLKLVARGLTNEQIGERLFISEATVRTHVSHILAKLGLGNRTQAALYALRVGLVTLEEIGRSEG